MHSVEEGVGRGREGREGKGDEWMGDWRSDHLRRTTLCKPFEHVDVT